MLLASVTVGLLGCSADPTESVSPDVAQMTTLGTPVVATPGTTSPDQAVTSSTSTSSTTTGPPPTVEDRPAVGAIRWDAWHGSASPVGEAVERSIGPAHWHCRLPFYGTATGTNEVTIRGNTQAIVDREIELAAAAGLDYWAFAFYPGADPDRWRDGPMNFGLDRYLKSAHRGDVRFSLILAQLGDIEEWHNQTVPELARLMSRSEYLKVDGGRPVLYVLADVAKRFGSAEAARGAIDDLRDAVRASGGRDPYLATMAPDAATGRRRVDELGYDAISAYATVGDQEHRERPYAELTASNLRFWETSAQTGEDVIPIVSAGWDPRPRWEHPVPWDPDPRPAAWYRAPSGTELAGWLREALGWEANHPAATPADLLIIYAWNEFDEGGWLAPTLAEGNARLNALASVLGGRVVEMTGTGAPCSSQP